MKSGRGPRRRAREIAFRLLYQAELTHDSIAVSWSQSPDAATLPDDARAYVDEIVQVLENDSAAIDQRIEAARGISVVSRSEGVPVMFGVITAGTQAQAEARAGTDGNKGRDAARAAVEFVYALREAR